MCLRLHAKLEGVLQERNLKIHYMSFFLYDLFFSGYLRCVQMFLGSDLPTLRVSHVIVCLHCSNPQMSFIHRFACNLGMLETEDAGQAFGAALKSLYQLRELQ